MTPVREPKALSPWSGVLLLGLAVGCAPLSTHSPKSPGRAQAERSFDFTYTASITNVPVDANQVRIWIPLAKTRDHQRIVSRIIWTALPHEIHEEPAFGNEMLYLALRSPIPQPLTIDIDYEVSVEGGRQLRAHRIAAPSTTHPSPSELALALRNEPFMVVNDEVARMTHEATTGQRRELQKARAIYDYVIRHMAYDKTTPGWGQGDTLRACALGKGNCTDFHSLFISMARSVGIPARFVIGASIPSGPEGEIPGYHCWAEFYTPEAGWVPVDASEAWKHPNLQEYYFGTRDPNKFLISEGRNIQLAPPQAGPPVNIFIRPYVEVDGTPLGAVETRFRFRSRQEQEVGT